jgi:hypothetical protein
MWLSSLKVLLGAFFYLGMVFCFRNELKVTNEKINYIIVFFCLYLCCYPSNGLGSKPSEIKRYFKEE